MVQLEGVQLEGLGVQNAVRRHSWPSGSLQPLEMLLFLYGGKCTAFMPDAKSKPHHTFDDAILLRCSNHSVWHVHREFVHRPKAL